MDKRDKNLKKLWEDAGKVNRKNRKLFEIKENDKKEKKLKKEGL